MAKKKIEQEETSEQLDNKEHKTKLELSKQQRVNLVIAAVEKEFGKGSMISMDEIEYSPCASISTGSIQLDGITGIGGFPRGRIVELFGQPGAGKSTLALTVVAEAQKLGGYCAYIDMEHGVDIGYAIKLGVVPSLTKFSQPDNGEDAMRIIRTCLESRAFDVIVLDSVAALVSKAELEGEIGDATIGLQARLMSSSLRIISPLAKSTTCCLIFINQTRAKIGYMQHGDTTSGGVALKFYSDIRVEIKKKSNLIEGEHQVGQIVRASVPKNKVGAPYKVCEFPIIFGQGISQVDELIDLGIEKGILTKSGAWVKHEESGKMFGPGRGKIRRLLKEDKEFFDFLKNKVLESMSIPES